MRDNMLLSPMNNRSERASHAASIRWNTPHKSTEERFWDKVDKRSAEQCWLWMGNRNAKGYGVFGVRGVSYKHAHRHAYVFTFGEIPPGLECAHRCHNRLCVNPAHLLACTHSDNMKHSAADGRLPLQNDPEKSNLRKLTKEDVLVIRSIPHFRGINPKLAKQFGVGPDNIRSIRNRRTWKHI